jgi:hypothetical protein
MFKQLDSWIKSVIPLLPKISLKKHVFCLERNMVGMFKQLDSWVKSVLPVLPYSTLQDSVLHLLQVSSYFVFITIYSNPCTNG